MENKIPDVSNLATKAALTTIENKIPDGSTLVIKSYYDTKIKNIENKYITTTEFNKLATDAFNTRTVQANLVKKTDFNNKLSDLNRKIISNKMKDISIVKGLSYFHGKNYFDEGGNQNYYIFSQFLSI